MKYWLSLIVMVILLGSCYTSQSSSGTSITGVEVVDARYFEETGHIIKGDFLHFFYIYGGVDSLGYPLTEEITVDGWIVQYFEKARLERHRENEPAYHITVGWVGDLLHRRQPPIPTANIPATNALNCHYFPETGHTLSGDFLRYFGAHGGSVRFGLPISEPFLWEGHLIQDFQSARFFWTPESDEAVTLEEIGRIHFEASGLNRKLLEAVEGLGEKATNQ